MKSTRKQPCKYVFWPGDRYAEARASEKIGEIEKKEVSAWCVLFGQDPRLIDFVSSGGACWLDVPAASRAGRLHIRPQVHVPESGARSSLFGLGIFYSDEWAKEFVPWDVHIHSFDAWFASNRKFPLADGTDLVLEEVGVADLPSPQFNLIARIDSKEIVHGGSYSELLEETRKLVLGHTTEWFSSIGIACNPPAADPRICAHLVARNFHKPGIRPYSPTNQVTKLPSGRTGYNLLGRKGHWVGLNGGLSNMFAQLLSSSKSKLTFLVFASVSLVSLFVVLRVGFGASEEAQLKQVANEADQVYKSLESQLSQIDSNITELQRTIDMAQGLKNSLIAQKKEAELIARALEDKLEQVKELVGQQNLDSVGAPKNGEEIETVQGGAAVAVPPTSSQVQSQVTESAETPKSPPVASEQPNAELNSIDSQKSSGVESKADTLEDK